MPNKGRVAKKNRLGMKQKMPKPIGLRQDQRVHRVCAANRLASLSKKIAVG
jgi:hypothetical protein